MGDKTAIEWTDATWTPIRARRIAPPNSAMRGKIGWHCEHVSEGCRNCYAETMNKRLGTGLDFKPGHRKDIELFLDANMLTAPLRWKKPRRVFVCSMTDLFADFVTDEWIDRMFAVMALCPQHTFQILTKRPERMREYITGARAKFAGEMLGSYEKIVSAAMGKLGLGPERFRETFPNGMPWPLPNVWLGTSVEDQERANERIPDLLATPAAVRFLSCEPLIGRVDLTNLCPFDENTHGWSAIWKGTAFRTSLDWVICGGESGPNARPMHPDWARALRDQCTTASVPFFFKQWGEWAPAPQVDDVEANTFEAARARGARDLLVWTDSGCREASELVGKRRAGRLLDGRVWNEYPEVAA